MDYAGFIYEWTNIVNGKKYIGSHKGRIDDGYMGSGRLFRAAVKKHGSENFVRKILEFVADKGMVFDREQYYLDMFSCASDPNYYNILPKARGGFADPTAHSDEWLVHTPSGEEIIIINMLDYCRHHGLNPSTMSAVARGRRRHHKGYRCAKLTNNRDVEYTYKEWVSKGHAAKGRPGGMNGYSKKIMVDNVIYTSMKEASVATGNSLYILRKIGKYCD